MITTDPTTWSRFQDHPIFTEYDFSTDWKKWYDNEPDEDLALLRRCAIDLLAKIPHILLELNILDDLTVYVEFNIRQTKGHFGVGCSPESVYVHLDFDPSKLEAPEIDNLTVSDFVELVCRFVAI